MRVTSLSKPKVILGEVDYFMLALNHAEAKTNSYQLHAWPPVQPMLGVVYHSKPDYLSVLITYRGSCYHSKEP